jgi:hypothetical protein
MTEDPLLQQVRDNYDRRWNKLLSDNGLGSLSAQQVASVIQEPLQAQYDAQVLQQELMAALTSALGASVTPENAEQAAYNLAMQQRWGKIGENTAKLSPETSNFLATYAPDERMFGVVEKTFQYLGQFYGPDQVGSWLHLSQIGDPDQRDETMRVLQEFANQTVMAEGSDYVIAQADPTYKIDPELLREVMMNPEMFDELGVQDKLEVQAAARQEMLQLDGGESLYGNQTDDSGLEITGQTVDAISGFLHTGNPRVAYSKEELGRIRAIAGMDASDLDRTGIAGVASLNDSSAPGELKLPEEYRDFGLISFTSKGGPEGAFRMDDQWAKDNPLKAVVLIERLKTQRPGVQIIFGKSGALGDTLEYFGVMPDFIGGVYGSAVQQQNELIEQWTGSNEDRLKASAEAQVLKDKLAQNLIPREDIQEVTEKIAELEDAANVDVGLQAVRDDIRESVLTGNQFGVVAEGFGYMPGDQGYSFVYPLGNLVTEIAFDPLTYAGGILKAAKLARDIPAKVLADGTIVVPKVSKGPLVQAIYRTMAKTPEELITTKPYQQALTKIWDSKVAAKDLGEWQARMVVNFKIDPLIARRLSESKSIEDLQRFFVRSMVGPNYKPGFIEDAYKRFKAAESQLDTINAIPERVAALRRQLAARKGVQTKLETKQFQIEDDISAQMDQLDQKLQLGDITEAEHAAALGDLNRLGRELSDDASFSTDKLEAARLERTKFEDELRELESQYAHWTSIKADVLSEYFYAKDLYEGRAWSRPISTVPSNKAIRRLYAYEDMGPLEKLIESASLGKSGFGLRTLEKLGFKKFLNHLQTKAGQAEEANVKTFFARNQHWFLDAPQGNRMLFPWSTITPQMRKEAKRAGTIVTIDAAQQTYDEIVNFFKLIGHDNDSIARYMSGWHEAGKSKELGFDWWVRTWEDAIDQSPLLTASDKSELSRLWSNVTESYGPGFRTTKTRARGSEGVIRDYEPTGFKSRPDPNHPGEYQVTPTPVFSQDKFDSYRLPTYNQMKQYLSFTQRTLKNMSEHGGAIRKGSAELIMFGGAMWSGAVNLWKNWVLLGKMPVSLPMRIWTEEMFRMAAFDYSSATRNPLGWLKSVRANSYDEFKMFAESPRALLGLMEDQLREATGLVGHGQSIYHITRNPDRYFRGMAGLIGHRTSQDVRALLRHNTPAKFLKWYEEVGQKKSYWRAWMDDIDSMISDNPGAIKDRATAIKYAQEELAGIIGTGDAAPQIRELMRTSAIVVDGKTIRVGDSELPKVLRNLSDTRQWIPGIDVVSSKYGEFLPDFGPRMRKVAEPAGRAANWMYEHFYTLADERGARSPLFRQIAAREFDRWHNLGYSKSAAKQLAVSRAARRTRDIMFNIGAHSPAEVTIRSLMPFFPAWRELATTWLFRVPKQYGGGKLIPGAVIFGNRVNDYMNFVKETGLVHQNEDGIWVAPNPIGGVLNMIFGEDLVQEVNLESFTGILPVPGLQEDEPLKGLLPTFGAPAAIPVGLLGDKFGGLFEQISDLTTFYGEDTSLGPAAVDRIWQVIFGSPPIWQLNGTREFNDKLYNWAIIDGIRIEMADNPPPQPPEGYEDNNALEQQYYAEYNTWLSEVLAEGQEYAKTTYLIKGIASALSPMALTWSSEEAIASDQMYGFLENIPGDAIDPMIKELYQIEYPGAWAYMTGKTIPLHPDLGFDVDNLDQFRDEVLSGMREYLTPPEWARYSVGMNSYFTYINQRSLAMKELGSTPAEVLTNGYQKNKVLDQLDADWKLFEDLQRSMPVEDGGRTFPVLLDIWKESKSEETTLTLEDEAILQFKQDAGEVALLLGPNARSDFDLGKAMGVLSKHTGDLDIKSSSVIGKGMSWWYDKVGQPYLEEVGTLWNKINRTEKQFRPPLYEKLRAIENQYYTTYKSRFGQMPSPQEVFFSNLSPKDQEIRLRSQASLPVAFMNEFYREKLGFDTAPEKKLNALATFLNTSEEAFDQKILSSGISTSSKEYDLAKARFEQIKLDKAKELGVVEEYKLWTSPTYVRMDTAFGLSKSNAMWSNVKLLADEAWRELESAGYNPSYGSEAAAYLQTVLVRTVEQYRDIDTNFDDIMTQFEEAYGDDGRPLVGADMYMKLFFDSLEDKAPDYIYR